MSRHPSTLPTPHRAEVDLTILAGVKVLGERAELLASAMFRLRFDPPRGDVVAVSATWPRHEARALRRAMGRVERPVPGDRRTLTQRDLDRFLAVADRVGEALQIARDCRAQAAFVRTD